MVQDVRQIAAADWQPRLGAHGEIASGLDDIHQCVRIILQTPKGSVPHRPEFGSDLWRVLDLPMREAVPRAVRESVDALRLWEPRIEVMRVSPQALASTHLRLDVEWRLKGRGEMMVTELRDGV